MGVFGNEKGRGILRRMVYELFGVGGDDELPTPATGAAQPTERKPSGGVTYIAPGTEIVGTLKTESDVEVCGVFQGDIISSGQVLLRSDLKGNVTAQRLELKGHSMEGDASVSGEMVIGEDASVTGHLLVGSLQCSGAINGDSQISGDAVLHKTARITGDISAGTLTAERGCQVKGNVVID